MNLYYECHVTIEPVFDLRLDKLKEIAEQFDFKVADLLLKKRESDTLERSQFDTFMTARSNDRQALILDMTQLITKLKKFGYNVWRYKIEDVIIDSYCSDIFNLCER